MRTTAFALVLATAAPAAAARSTALRAFATAMAAGDWANAHAQLSAADRRAIGAKAFAARYRVLAAIPWVGAVLRSARVEGGRLTALDWSHTRFARAAVLREQAANLPRRVYLPGASVRRGKLHLGLAPGRPRSATAEVRGTAHDWFALHATVAARCPAGARWLVIEVAVGTERAESAFDCTVARGRDEIVVWADLEPRDFARSSVSARVLGAVARRPAADPFRAPDPDLLASPGYPVAGMRKNEGRRLRGPAP